MSSIADFFAYGPQAVLAVLSGLLFCSFGEYAIHRHLMHRMRLPAWCYRAAPDLRAQFTHHAVLHHGTYYKQFDHEPSAEGKYLNLRIQLPDTLRVLAMLSPLFVAAAILVSPAVMVMLMLVVIAQNVLWNQVHVQMHVPETNRWFRHTAYFRFIARHHFMHHRQANANFNVVLPFADFVLGTVAIPRRGDIREMLRLGYLKPRTAAGRRFAARHYRPQVDGVELAARHAG